MHNWGPTKQLWVFSVHWSGGVGSVWGRTVCVSSPTVLPHQRSLACRGVLPVTFGTPDLDPKHVHTTECSPCATRDANSHRTQDFADDEYKKLSPVNVFSFTASRLSLSSSFRCVGTACLRDGGFRSYEFMSATCVNNAHDLLGKFQHALTSHSLRRRLLRATMK